MCNRCFAESCPGSVQSPCKGATRESLRLDSEESFRGVECCLLADSSQTLVRSRSLFHVEHFGARAESGSVPRGTSSSLSHIERNPVPALPAKSVNNRAKTPCSFPPTASFHSPPRLWPPTDSKPLRLNSFPTLHRLRARALSTASPRSPQHNSLP